MSIRCPNGLGLMPPAPPWSVRTMHSVTETTMGVIWYSSSAPSCAGGNSSTVTIAVRGALTT